MPTSTPKIGEVKHSAEGYWPGIYSRLDGPDRASWQFTVGYDHIEQHYLTSANCWHAGDADDDGGVLANIDLVGVEHLGRVGEPLTPYQVDATARLTGWLAETNGRPVVVRYPQIAPHVWTLAEHNEVSDTATSCPSGRIPWAQIIARVKGVAIVDQDAINREFFNALARNGAEHDRILGLVREIGRVVGEHLQDEEVHGYMGVADITQLLADIDAQIDELNEKLRGAAAVLSGGT